MINLNMMIIPHLLYYATCVNHKFEKDTYSFTSRGPGVARGNSGFPELLGFSPVGLWPIRGPLYSPASRARSALRADSAQSGYPERGSGNPEPQLSPCRRFGAHFAGPLSPSG